MSIAATRNGPCARCDSGIKEGQLIETDIDGEWGHLVCPPVKPIVSCSSCFMQLTPSGECPSGC